MTHISHLAGRVRSTPEPVAPIPDYKPSWTGADGGHDGDAAPENPIFGGSGTAKSAKTHKAHKVKHAKSWKSKTAKSSKGMFAWWNGSDDGDKGVAFNKDGSRQGDVAVESGAHGSRSLGRICGAAALAAGALALMM